MPDRAVVELMEAAVQAEIAVERAQHVLEAAREGRWSAHSVARKMFKAQPEIAAMTVREQQDAYADALSGMLREARSVR